jgi:hypothetical protein
MNILTESIIDNYRELIAKPIFNDMRGSGGGDKNCPYGGFLPILLCKTKNNNNNNNNNNNIDNDVDKKIIRETPNKIINKPGIKDILNNRRKNI